MEMALGRRDRRRASADAGESKLKSVARPNYSGEVVANRGLDASRGINRSLTDSSLRFLTYNRRRNRELQDFRHAYRKAPFMQRKGRLTAVLDWRKWRTLFKIPLIAPLYDRATPLSELLMSPVPGYSVVNYNYIIQWKFVPVQWLKTHARTHWEHFRLVWFKSD